MLKKICKVLTIIAGVTVVSVVVSRIIGDSKSEDDGKSPS
jgi:hypothetical protein